MSKRQREKSPLDRLPGFIPKDLRQLLAFVPSRGWDALEWRPLLSQLRRISWQLARKSSADDLAFSLDGEIPGLVMGNADGKALETLSTRQRITTGDTILRLYFTQFRNPQGIFLDLRSSRFVSAESSLHFRPSGLYAQLDSEFRVGMINLYRGFYEPDEALLDQALLDMGFLRPDLSAAEADELRALLHSHFGSQQRSQTFSIAAFKTSFDALFDFFIDHNYRLRSDFVMVGFYLITLYLALEELGQSHDVKRICQETLLG